MKIELKEIDSLLDDGIKQGSLNLLCSKASMGKTTFALNLMSNNINDKIIAYFNFELSKDKLFERMNKLFDTDYTNKNIFVYKYDYNKTVDDIINKCIELKKSNMGLDLVIIDYIELISCEINTVRKKDFNSYILSKLYQLVKEYNVSVVLVSLCQRTNKEISVNDLFLDKDSLDKLDNIFYLYNGNTVEIIKK